jgi:hypothetical protein
MTTIQQELKEVSNQIAHVKIQHDTSSNQIKSVEGLC